MGRAKVYANAAERQKAYRSRLAKPEVMPTPPKKVRPLSRPARLAKVERELRTLATEYELWMENLPESLCDSTLASALEEAITKLTEAADTLAEVQLPLGFGRD